MHSDPSFDRGELILLVVEQTRGQLARKHFPPSALPAAETPFCIDAASVSARHMRAPSHRPTRGNMPVSAQAALFQAAERKLLSASCCTQVSRHLSSSCSVHVVQFSLRKTLGACIRAQDAQPELSCGGAARAIRLRFRVAIFRWEPPGVHSTY